MTRIAALLHDMGHGPFSHVFEHLLVKNLDKTHEDITAWLVEKSEVGDKLSSIGYSAKEVAQLAIGRLHKPGRAFLDQIISSAVDVDKQDFIVRGHVPYGAEYGFNRCVQANSRVGCFGRKFGVELGALSALEALIIARIESFKSIYFHRVGRAAQIMLATAMEKANEELGLTAFKTPEEYLAMDAYTVWAAAKKCVKSRPIIEALERRRMLNCAYERTFNDKDTFTSNIFSQEAYRQQVRAEIAREAKIDVDAVVIDVPTVPSVPYHHSAVMENRNPVFSKTTTRKNDVPHERTI
jgi:HD superfamily phosphohydrolase